MGDFENKTDDLVGKAKETAGKVSGDESLENEGKGEQIKSDIKEGIENVKDKVSEGLGKLKGDE